MNNNTPYPLVQDPPKVAKVTVVATSAQDDAGGFPPLFNVHLVTLDFVDSLPEILNDFELILKFGNDNVTVIKEDENITDGRQRLIVFTGSQLVGVDLNTSQEISVLFDFTGRLRADSDVCYQYIALPKIDANLLTPSLYSTEELENAG